MADESLIADVESTRKPWTGFGLAETAVDAANTIQGGSWIDQIIMQNMVTLELGGAIMDPFSTLLSNGISWTIEYFEPLREILDALTGKPDLVASHADTWNNMAEELFGIAEELQSKLGSELGDWSGDAANAYQEMMAHNVEAIGGLGGTAMAMAEATTGAGNLVQMVRELARDCAAEAVARVVVVVLEAMGIVTIPAIAATVASTVLEWTGKALTYVMALVESFQNLRKLLDL